MKGFQKGDPRAVLAGRKGGKVMRATRTPEYIRGFKAGWAAKKRIGLANEQTVQPK